MFIMSKEGWKPIRPITWPRCAPACIKLAQDVVDCNNFEIDRWNAELATYQNNSYRLDEKPRPQAKLPDWARP